MIYDVKRIIHTRWVADSTDLGILGCVVQHDADGDYISVLMLNGGTVPEELQGSTFMGERIVLEWTDIPVSMVPNFLSH